MCPVAFAQNARPRVGPQPAAERVSVTARIDHDDGMNPPVIGSAAPPWSVSRWCNVAAPLSLESLRGRPIALHAFQMTCPGCLAHGLPQAERMQRVFAGSDLVVVALHTVFENHAAQTEGALADFVDRRGFTFPVGADAHDDPLGLPLTMARYGMQGTPTLVLIDRWGLVRRHTFGRADDMAVGADVARMLLDE